jgi:benzoate membrane transport protein
MQLWETDTRFGESLRALPKAITLSTLSAGLLTSVMGATGPMVLVYQAAKLADYTPQHIGSWIFAILAGSGVMSVLMALMYRQPATSAYSMAGSALLVQVLPQYGLHAAVGAYLMGAVLILLLALSGLFNRLIALLPPEIVMAMLAGVLLNFGIAIFPQMVGEPLVVGPMLLAFLLSSRLRSLVPPITVALAVAVGQTLIFYPPQTGEGIRLVFTLPGFYAPTFSLDAFLSITLPLVLLTLSSQNATGIGMLLALGYKPRVTAITFFTGLFSLLTAPMAGPGINLATPGVAICGDRQAHHDPDMRYGATIVFGVLFIAYGLLGQTVLSVMETLPRSMIVVIAGLAMMPVILSVLQQSFSSGRRPMGASFALVIAASNVQVFGVGAAFWSLVLGSLISLLLDPKPEDVAKAELALDEGGK